MYKVKDEVTIIKTGEVKQIIDFETVCGVEVYYMSDKTAYPINEITYLDGLVEYTVEYEDGYNWGYEFMKSLITGEEFDYSRKMPVSEIKQHLIESNPGMSINTLRIFMNNEGYIGEFIINGEKYIYKTDDSYEVIPKNESFIKRAVRIFKDLKNNLTERFED